MLMRAKVSTAAESLSDARALATQVRLDTSAGQIKVQAPDQDKNRGWSVEFELFVPQRADLSLKTFNGGISIADVRGHIQFDALNGGVSLVRLGGDVEGRTTNGGLTVELAGNRWDGQKMDVSTTNGGVNMRIPENYSARLETGTVNGGINVDFPVTLRGEISRRLSIDLGSGGPVIRAVTTNGGVNIKRTGPNKATI
jgi:DUF4097 and DUF4098 domain-containing protein YvlB